MARLVYAERAGFLLALHSAHRKADTKMAKGQEKKATTNKPKLTVKEKKDKKKAKSAK